MWSISPHLSLFKQLPSLSSPVFLPLVAPHIWLLADTHTGSIAHLPNFSSSCLAPTLLLSASFSLLSLAPCITISRHALGESDEYFSSSGEGLHSSFYSSAFNTTNGPESVFFFRTTLHHASSFLMAPGHKLWGETLYPGFYYTEMGWKHWGWLDLLGPVAQTEWWFACKLQHRSQQILLILLVFTQHF